MIRTLGNWVRNHLLAFLVIFLFVGATLLAMILKVIPMSQEELLMITVAMAFAIIFLGAFTYCGIKHYADAMDYMEKNSSSFKEAWKETKVKGDW